MEDFREFRRDLLLQKCYQQEIQRLAVLHNDLTIALLTCALECEDLSDAQAKALQQTLQKLQTP